ncbi:adenylate and guanylate cyclase catalytic domain-containing protein [Ditylenchus destructor]|uniref:Adenylate and guanylate cyclase catalytic domain-containing protein n=1 Tax=Ditylenchus destructor TaxID=166010 RepID=A0AAD4R388_9BILA|nr:adenylate and guanylate cyclase catalytic domain-containing protein [Ditylenchus destructor]
MASRMESTGLPEKIQISEPYKEALEKYFAEFKVSHRGPIEIKGKGECQTYWLEGKESGAEPLPPPPVTLGQPQNAPFAFDTAFFGRGAGDKPGETAAVDNPLKTRKGSPARIQ